LWDADENIGRARSWNENTTAPEAAEGHASLVLERIRHPKLNQMLSVLKDQEQKDDKSTVMGSL
jgi:ERCC4-related helicase